ncbi:uncharacterized protein DUF563 [Corticibacter populi]|nr:uncharacterized protein DUF563 [Corticibacter populi]
MLRYRNGGQSVKGSPRRADINEGWITRCNVSGVGGWALTGGQPAMVQISVGETVLAVVRCDQKSSAMEARGLSAGGFHYRFPAAIDSQKSVSVQFMDGTPLRRSPATPDAYEGHLEFCSIAHVTGWALFEGKQTSLDVFVDGEPVATIRADIHRARLADFTTSTEAVFYHEFRHSIDPDSEISIRFPDGKDIPGSPQKPSKAYPDNTRFPISKSTKQQAAKAHALDMDAEIIRAAIRASAIGRSLLRNGLARKIGVHKAIAEFPVFFSVDKAASAPHVLAGIDELAASPGGQGGGGMGLSALRIEDAIVIPQSSIIVRGGRFYGERQAVEDGHEPHFVMAGSAVEGPEASAEDQDMPVCALDAAMEPVLSMVDAVTLTSSVRGNLAHWMLHELIPWAQALRAGIIHSRVPVLLDDDDNVGASLASKKSAAEAAATLMGGAQSQPVPIGLSGRGACQVARLWKFRFVPAPANSAPRWVRLATPPDVLGAFVRGLTSPVQPSECAGIDLTPETQAPGTRIFIEDASLQGGAYYDQLLNRTIAQARGFQAIDPAGMTFNEQIVALRNASHVLVPHTATALLALFMREGGRIAFTEPCEATLAALAPVAHALGLGMAAPVVDEDSPQTPASVEFAHFLHQWLAGDKQ